MYVQLLPWEKRGSCLNSKIFNAKSFTDIFAPLTTLPSSNVDQALIKLDLSASPSIIESLEFNED